MHWHTVLPRSRCGLNGCAVDSVVLPRKQRKGSQHLSSDAVNHTVATVFSQHPLWEM